MPPLVAVGGEIESQPINDNDSYLDSEKVGKTWMYFVNVKDFGAVGDGVSDDSAAFQAALDIANTNGYVTVLVPEGTYRLAAELIVYANTKLQVDPNATIIRDHTANFATNGLPTDSFSGYNGNGNITVEGGTWDANSDAQPDIASGFQFGHAKNLLFRNLIIKDVPGGHAIEINSTDWAIVENSQFLGFYDTGGRDFSEAIQIDLAKNSSTFSKFGSYDNTPCKNITVKNCYFGASGTAGTTAWPRGIGSHSATNGYWHEDIKIYGNTFDGLTQWGVRGYSWKNVSVSGKNHFFSCGAGITIDPPDSQTTDSTGTVVGSQNIDTITVSDNIIKDVGTFGSAISVSGLSDGKLTEINVGHNIINGTATGTLGIYLRYAIRSNVGNNVLQDIGSTGISINDSESATTVGNTVENCAGSGITNNQTNVVNSSGNTIRNCADYGVLVNGTSYNATVSGNLLVGISSDGTKEPIRIVSSVNQFNVTGNTAANATGYTARYGIYVSGTCVDGLIDGNNVAGLGIQVDTGATNVVQGTNVA